MRIKSIIDMDIGILVFILVHVIELVHGFKEYHSCADIKKDLGTGAVDKEYVIYLWNKVGVTLYCHGLQTDNPQEYITLQSGKTYNYAYFYENVGDNSECADKFPRKIYASSGKSEFTKIAIDVASLKVDTGDFTFSSKVGRNPIRYGTAGDHYSYSKDCTPMGSFQIDLTGTPFAVTNGTTWSWTGNFTDTEVTDGTASVNDHAYIGCFKDKNLLPSPVRFSPHDQTSANCIRYCRGFSYLYGGTKHGSMCHCGNYYDRSGAQPVDDSFCNSPCAGNSTEMCGGALYLSIYHTDVPQRYTGRCGGYPGQCFPVSSSNPKESNLLLDIMNGEHSCVKNNPCQNEGRCIAVNSKLYKCQCYDGYSGTNCETVKVAVIEDKQTCPTGYQAETCMCFEERCNGAKFDGDSCVSSTGKVTCRPGDPGHVILFNVDGQPRVRCPDGAEIVGCAYWSSYIVNSMHGQGRVDNGTCTACHNCKVQARCKQHICGCQNGGHCNRVTFQCECRQSYYGEKCEIFDYCAHYEATHNNTSPCAAGGICAAVPRKLVRATGGDRAGDSCSFPFDYKNHSFNTCVENNIVGPPFACAGQFDMSESYIDLGQWSPGASYTVAAWVRPAIVDNIRRTVAGGVSQCNDFGFNLNSGTFRGFLKLSKECTRDLDAGEPIISVGKWYMIAVSCNSTHATIYQNSEFKERNTVLRNNIPTTDGFRIGGEVCCPNDFFHGLIKTVKVWNRGLSNEEINLSMYNIGTKNSTVEALHDGLVGHWELGDTGLPACSGGNAIDHGGEDWTLTDGQFVGGIHCNISKFLVPRGTTVTIVRYNGKTGGILDITAQEVQIDGMINGVGSGYRGGVSSSIPGDGGQQGGSYNGMGTKSVLQNHGGGGGGLGGNPMSDGKGRSGGGAGYGSQGFNGVNAMGDKAGLGLAGQVYGDADLNILYLGAGGGSGGNAKDLTTNPKGGRGGNGGGAVKIVAQKSIVLTGVISVAGESGQGDTGVAPGCMDCPDSCNQKSAIQCLGNSTLACWDMSGPGGGGSGGSIYLSSKLVNVGHHKLWTMGGPGGAGGGYCCGGPGGMGRIRVDSIILKGVIKDQHAQVKTTTLQDKFIDHSQTGQKQIDYQNTRYGNEVYRGCFSDNTSHRTLAVTMSLTGAMKYKMSPQYCQNMCRQRNYKFSGTRNGNECYCDNHLDISKKSADSGCDVQCTGDPLQNCGGKGLLQVFGPPPGSPAIGKKVVPKCEPWCVTADANMANPKWGLCANTPDSVADWTVQCQCPPGKIGVLCDQPCPNWKYGNGCRQNCTCNVTTTAECNPSNGICSCKPGYYGNNCEKTCKPGYYGQNCANTCSCSQNSQCDHVKGDCSCKPGWSGVNCNFPCPENTFGSGCTQKCNCNHGTCSPEHGQCQCLPGYKLPSCFERCDNYTSGQDCLQTCHCNNQLCDPVTGACQCGPGYIGPQCNIMCPFGTWGQKCVKTCQCGGFGCDHVTGICNCGAGFQGDSCELDCAFGTFGEDCNTNCKCVMNQTQVCSTVNGACSCADGYYGFRCEMPCHSGYYGRGCSKLCQCYNGATCDHRDGSCLCAPGFTGNQCENKCLLGRYGPNCGQSCSSCPPVRCSIVDGHCHSPCQPGPTCHCSNNTWGITTTCNNICGCKNGQCDEVRGSCLCNPGWQGQFCDLVCINGYYGIGCNSVCSCVNGKCDPVTGNCVCSAGYNGTDCDAVCPSGTYGADCRFTCPKCGSHSYSYPSCDVKTGDCLCSDGYTGPLCDRPCPQGTYGANCSSKCICHNNGVCDSVTGKCLCSSGFLGNACEKHCPAGSWGMNCTKPCDCGPHGDGCTPVEGLCRCKPGFTGVKCRQSCPVSTYGQNCTSTCRCPPSTSMCSPIDGTCLCKPGFAGQLCDAVCNPGFWGHECSQKCQCNDRGSCNPFTGECDCGAGYKGTHCETQCDQDIYWGKNCENYCSCNGGHCNHKNGVCSCPAGKTGKHCEQDCDSLHYGFNCASVCMCDHEGACDHVSGECTCKPGWTGASCMDACPGGKFGLGCLQDCPDCQNDGACDPATGKCLCLEAYTGPLCNTTVTLSPLAHAQVQKLTSSSGIHFTVPQLVGLIVGFLFLLIVAAVVAVLLTRRRYVGRFSGTTGAVKFTSEEVDMGSRPAEVTASTTGFSNPVHEMSAKEEPGSESKPTTTKRAAASCMVDSDDEDSKYFKDSSA